MDDFPPIVADIVRDCLRTDPPSRPTANDVAERLVRWQFRKVYPFHDGNGNTYLHRRAHFSNFSRFLSRSNNPLMINVENFVGETPLMCADEEAIQSFLSYMPVPPENEEPSRIPECLHNIDVFGALMRLAENQNVAQIKRIGGDSEERRSVFKDEKHQTVKPRCT